MNVRLDGQRGRRHGQGGRLTEDAVMIWLSVRGVEELTGLSS